MLRNFILPGLLVCAMSAAAFASDAVELTDEAAAQLAAMGANEDVAAAVAEEVAALDDLIDGRGEVDGLPLVVAAIRAGLSRLPGERLPAGK
mgnify:CR=1 FL=1